MLIFNAFHQSDLFGKMIFLSLFLFSIVTWYLFLKKMLIQKDIRKKGMSLLLTFQKNKTHPLSLEMKEDPLNPFFEIYKNMKLLTLELLKKNQLCTHNEAAFLSSSDLDFIESKNVMTISLQTKVLENHLFVLSTIVSLAPFCGLLGTVWGILLTFNEIQKGIVVQANATVMGGLAMALGTTVVGLIVAIPALVAYNYLKASIGKLTMDMEDFSHLLLSSIEIHYRKVEL